MKTNAKITIILVDDHKLIRETWKFLLEQEEKFTVIAECDRGDIAVQKAKELSPDIMLMDINMSPINGFEATKRITQEVPNVKVIGMSINNQPSYAKNMIQVGAKGYVTKNSTREEMIEAILEVWNGNEYICREIKDKMNNNHV